MRRVAEKVRDIVEVCPFANLHDFSADPALTLAGYHFTDITADLMAKWIDRVAAVRPGSGTAYALAGFRGVGKSHFLSVLGSILSKPELRRSLPDAHVATAAERLSRRHGAVAMVRRGAGISLLDELKSSIANLLGVNPGTLSDSLNDLLVKGADHAGELPLVLLIDTALDRAARVSRNDGVLLSEMAEVARALGIFVGVALDDDISGADGANSTIAANFTIDYLDQEHLYKIVDKRIFTKHSNKLSVLHEIYEGCRSALPAFRWSEQRFTALYPLHPATLEIAPLIRLYLQDFALLGFASDAGVKILGRPADSLIGLDEVFDSVEQRLRQVSELTPTFAAFDHLEHEVVAKTAVQARLQAKLILKGLLMLSLDGRGATASELAAAMMIYQDETAPQSVDLGSVLQTFSEALPDALTRTETESGGPRYCLRAEAKTDFTSVLSAAAAALSDEVVERILSRHSSDKFSEVDPETSRLLCSIEWRGGLRRGVVYRVDDVRNSAGDENLPVDWSVVMRAQGDDSEDSDGIVWRLAQLTDEERDTIKRSHILHNDEFFRSEYGESATTAAHVHALTLEKIWHRIYIADAALEWEGTDFALTGDANSTNNLSQLLSGALRKIFDATYDLHPDFRELLTAEKSSALIEGFFSGSDVKSPEMQKMAESFAVPLGLATRAGDDYVPASSEALWALDMVGLTFGDAQVAAERTFTVHEVSAGLKARPFGLAVEAQRLLMAAMVGQRQFEFVTKNGDRINQRSLDLQIVWDDIVALANPADERFSNERLLYWARSLTGNSAIPTIDRTEDRLLVVDSLSNWLAQWRSERVLERFDLLPDENLSASIWRTVASLRRSYGEMASSVQALIAEEVTLEECLNTIAGQFSDSEAEYERKKDALRSVKEHLVEAQKRTSVASYMAVCEPTDDEQVEQHRRRVLDLLLYTHAAQSEVGLDTSWTEFKRLYSEHYRSRHNSAMQRAGTSPALTEILGSNEWAAFTSLCSHPWFDAQAAKSVRSLIRMIGRGNCQANLAAGLEESPVCSCGFRMESADRQASRPMQAQSLVAQSVDTFRVRLLDNYHGLMRALESMTSDQAAAETMQILAEFNGTGVLPVLTSDQVRILREAAAAVDRGPDSGSRSGASGWQPEAVSPEMFAHVDN